MTRHDDLPLDASEADYIEQHQPVVDDEETELPDELPLLDADPADAIDQLRAVPLDDDR